MREGEQGPDQFWTLVLDALRGTAVDVEGSPQEPLCLVIVAPRQSQELRAVPARPPELLTDSETRVLHYLPTHLPAPEIAKKLCLSVHTVRTHMRHLYEKLSVHNRTQAVEQARALGLLAPASSRAAG
jgi:LuxR family transcriptional regulator, maltose regulon positive regulatory protein